MATNKMLESAALLLASIGALNWGLVAFANVDLVAALFGAASLISNVLYGVVALAGIYTLYMFIQSLSK